VSRVFRIDGCGLDCARAALREVGFERFDHLRVTDMGLDKGKSPANEANVAKIVVEGRSRLVET